MGKQEGGMTDRSIDIRQERMPVIPMEVENRNAD